MSNEQATNVIVILSHIIQWLKVKIKFKFLTVNTTISFLPLQLNQYFFTCFTYIIHRFEFNEVALDTWKLNPKPYKINVSFISIIHFCRLKKNCKSGDWGFYKPADKCKKLSYMCMDFNVIYIHNIIWHIWIGKWINWSKSVPEI